MRAPFFCAVCEPENDQFAACEGQTDHGCCANFFCREHGDIDGKMCEDCEKQEADEGKGKD